MILAAVRPQGAVAVGRALGEYAEVVPVMRTAMRATTANGPWILAAPLFVETRRWPQ